MAELTALHAPASLHTGEIDQAVLRTLAYSDIFDFPLKLNELHRYLIQHSATPETLHLALARLSHIVQDRELYALRGREGNFALRRRRAANAARLWPQARRFGRLIAVLPFVRMVAVTGALASDNVEPGADLDYLIVTRPGRLWLVRAMVLALNRIARLFGLRTELCPNYLLSTNELALQDRDLFTAQELARMIPLSGLDVYAAMRAANSWTDEILPNAAGAPAEVGSVSGPSLFKRVVEALLLLPPVSWLETWEMKRKIAKFSREGQLNSETRFAADFCKGHFDGHKQATLAAFESRLRELGLA
jgi:hypothetical protein